MRFILGIIGLLVVALLLISLLDKLGMSEVVNDAGAHIRGKAGFAQTDTSGKKEAKGQSSPVSKEAYVKEIIGWNIRDINSKPLEFIHEAKQKVQREIDRMEDISLMALKNKRRAEREKDLVSDEIEPLKELLSQARLILQDETTQYPVMLGGYSYTEDMLLQAASDAKNRIKALEQERPFRDNLPAYSEETHAEMQRKLEALHSAMSLLLMKEKALKDIVLREDAMAAKAAAEELDDAVNVFFTPEDFSKQMPFGSLDKRSNKAQLRKNVFSD